MIIELTPEQRYDEERVLPPIFTTKAERDSGKWSNNFYPDRINWYTLLVVESGLIRGGERVIPQFIAAMIQESGLNNLVFHDANPDPEFGLYWVALDSTGHMPQTRAEIVRFRSDPLIPLEYVAKTPDLTNHGGLETWFNKKRWNAWTQGNIDPRDVAVWSPLNAALTAWDTVNE